MTTPRRLYRCRTDRKVAGVAAGVAEFFELDPSVVRVAWFLSIFFGGLGLFLYVVMAFIVPLEPITGPDGLEIAPDHAAPDASGHRHAAHDGVRWSMYAGLALVLFGGLALIDSVIPGWDSWRYFGPMLFIGLGAILVAGAMRRESTNP